MSTTDQAEAERLGGIVIAAGGAAVDCPVSGGCHRADTGNISIFAGCDRSTFERVLPLLKTMGRRILHTGELGSASMLKVLRVGILRKLAKLTGELLLELVIAASTHISRMPDSRGNEKNKNERVENVRSEEWTLRGHTHERAEAAKAAEKERIKVKKAK